MALKPTHHSEKVSLYHQWQPQHRIWRRYRWYFPQKRTAAKGIFSLELMMASPWSPDLTVQKACFHWQGHPIPGPCLSLDSFTAFSLPVPCYATPDTLGSGNSGTFRSQYFPSPLHLSWLARFILITLGSEESLPQQRRCSAHSTSCQALTLALLSGLRPFG